MTGLEYRFEDAGGLLTVTVTGEWSLEPAKEMIDRVAQECEQRGCRRVLLDALAIEIDGRMLQFERYMIGERIVARLSEIRLAVLMPEEQINRFVETMVRGAGAQMLVTSDRDEAAAWL